MLESDQTTCIDFRKNGSGTETHYYDPIEKHSGLTNFFMESYRARNRITVFNKIGQSLMNINYFSGSQNGSFYYDHSRDGTLTIAVGSENQEGDAWRVEISCDVN